MRITNIKLAAITAFAFSSLLMGCSEEVYDGAYKPSLESHYLSVNPRDFEFGNGEETKTGSVTSENAWSFTSVPSWLSLSPSSGNSDAKFSVTSSANETMSSRTGVFFLTTKTTDWNAQKTLTVSQLASAPFFNFSDIQNTSIYLSGESHTLTINVETNIEDLTPKISDGGDWLSATYQNKQLTINISANDDGYSRTDRVLLWSSTYSKGGTIYITQYKPNLSFNDITSLSFDADGGNSSVVISSEIPWFATSKEPWIEISPSNGIAGDNNIRISVQPSYQIGDRNGKVLFYYKDNQSDVGSISITQSGRYINIGTGSITLSAEENDSEIIEISSNIDWEISTCPEWITVDPQNGKAGNTSIIITAQKNNSLNSRSGTITIKDSMSGHIEKKLSVIQNGIDFGDDTTLEFGWQASTHSLDIPIPNKWSAAVSTGWIVLSQYSGDAASTCDVSVTRNDSDNPRTGEIIFTSEGQTITVSVVQNGQYLNLDVIAGEISSIGGRIELQVNTSVDIIPTIQYNGAITDWVSCETESNNQFFLDIDNNPSINQRTATLVLTPKDGDVKDDLIDGVKFSIKQFGRDLRVEPSIIKIFAKGGTTESYSISADGAYSIEKPEEFTWFTLVHDNAINTYYIVATENSNEAVRRGYFEVSLLDLPDGEEKKVTIEIEQKSIHETEINYTDYDEDKTI